MQNNQGDDIQHLDDSDDDFIFEPSNDCQACGGDDQQDNVYAWIGCNDCPRWFHKYCLGVEYENMSLKEMNKINYMCKICERTSKK